MERAAFAASDYNAGTASGFPRGAIKAALCC